MASIEDFKLNIVALDFETYSMVDVKMEPYCVALYGLI